MRKSDETNETMEESKETVEESKETMEQIAPEENKETVEQIAPEENKEQIDIDELEEASAEPDITPAKQKKEGAGSWSEKSVTRKFVVIALAAAVLLNTAISAGITGALLRKQTKEMPAMSGNGHMRNEMHFDNDHSGKGNTTAPETGQNTEQAQQQSSKASIGVIIKEDSGVIVAQITGENAKKAGFKEGDKIVSVEGKNISASSDLISEVQSHKSGDTITVTVERDGQNIEIKTVLD